MKLSAGLLLYRWGVSGELEVLLVHPGGPFWARKDERAWSIPKGEYEDGDDPREVAAREFREELGSDAPRAAWVELGELPARSGKRIVAWAVEGDLDPSTQSSNTFELEWPPRSGRHRSFPEVDRAEWFDLDTARDKLHAGQVELIDRLNAAVGVPSDDG